jgi:hypothetical protein
MFSPAIFQTKLAKVNDHMSRFRQSALEPLLRALPAVPGPVLGALRDAVQECVLNIPHDKQAKYADALGYLAGTANIVVGARPTDPTMELVYYQANQYQYVATDGGQNKPNTEVPGHQPLKSYHHVFDIKWKSSNGNMASLANVGTREHVKFRTQPGEAPFTDALADTPIEFFHGQSTSGANTGYGRDDHFTKPPSLVCRQPWEAGELVADQWYQYTLDNGTTWKNIPGAAYNLIKGVRRDNQNRWVFYFSKRNWAPHNTKRFNFEVEYLLQVPFPPPAPGRKLGKAYGGSDHVRPEDHCSRVISRK